VLSARHQAHREIPNQGRVTDSVPLNDAAKGMGRIKILSVADLLARGIRSIHEETSISELFI
jgi:ribose-phosphate pyrophosphokinase